MELSEKDIARFWKYVDKKGEDECWEWKGGKGKEGNIDGRGIFVTHHERKRYNHKTNRVSWFIHNGIIPNGLCVLHKCDNPPCCNPRHLFLGTLQDNVRDCLFKGRVNRTIKARGENSGVAKFKNSDISEIRKMISTGISSRSIAIKYKVANSTICSIRRGSTWRHICDFDGLQDKIDKIGIKDGKTKPHFSRLNKDLVIKIRDLYMSNTKTHKDIADELKISPTTVHYVLNSRTWKDVK